MFIKANILKKLMKEAFKANFLIIGRKEDDYYIQGVYWKFLCNKNFIPKTIYAQIIELAGEIPDEGECFCSGKGGNQMQINSMEIEIPGKAERVDMTDLVLEHKTGTEQRILQFENGFNVLINNMFAVAVKGKNYEEELGELPPEGPYCHIAHGVFWENNVMRFQAAFRQDDEHERMLKNMGTISLTEKDEISNG